MFKFLRVPEKLFSVVMWFVSLLFASFLIGLGSQLVGELPGVTQAVEIEEFVDRAADRAIEARTVQLQERIDALQRERVPLQQAADTAAAAEASARREYETWASTRSVTSDSAQNPEVLARTRRLEALLAQQRAAERRVEAVDAELIAVGQRKDSLATRRAQLRDAAQPAYERARFATELRVFGIRLALTLPLLVIAGWAIARKRKSEYWPLWRGFVLFATLTFFGELVPYLPSYGGYVRSVVGIVASLVAGHYTIRWMRAYVARREAEAQRSAVERRRTLGWEEALKRVNANICPGCERPLVATPGSSAVNFCVHCGLQTYDQCDGCGTRKNAFFAYCPSCGVRAREDAAAAAVS